MSIETGTTSKERFHDIVIQVAFDSNVIEKSLELTGTPLEPQTPSATSNDCVAGVISRVW